MRPEGPSAAPKRPIAWAKNAPASETILRPAQRAVLDALVDTFVPPDADLSMAQAMVAAALDRLAPDRRAKLALVLSLLGNPLAMLAVAGRPHGFAALARPARERALRGLAAIAPLRPAFAAFGRLSLFAAYAAADEQGSSAVWERLGYPGPRGDVPARDPFPTVAPPPDGRIVADAVVIGSGAGGGVAAALLAQAGLRVVVLEAGSAFEPVAARQREAESFAQLYLEHGLCASEDGGVSILAGACMGGGTAVNWSTSLRLPPAVAAGWGQALDRPAFAGELADAYDVVETRLSVTPATSHNRNNAVLADGCAKLGWSCRVIPRNAECSGDQCGYCGFGCAYGNKRSTAATYLRDALAHGAQVYAGTRADRVVIENGTARGVEATTEGGARLVIGAPLVVVAAGTLRTPGILARSGVSSPHLGQHLHLHPVTALSAEFDEPVESWHGAMQTAVCDQFADLFGRLRRRDRSLACASGADRKCAPVEGSRGARDDDELGALRRQDDRDRARPRRRARRPRRARRGAVSDRGRRRAPARDGGRGCGTDRLRRRREIGLHVTCATARARGRGRDAGRPRRVRA